MRWNRRLACFHGRDAHVTLLNLLPAGEGFH